MFSSLHPIPNPDPNPSVDSECGWGSVRAQAQPWTAGKTSSAVAQTPPAPKQRIVTLILFKGKTTALSTSVFTWAGAPSHNQHQIFGYGSVRRLVTHGLLVLCALGQIHPIRYTCVPTDECYLLMQSYLFTEKNKTKSPLTDTHSFSTCYCQEPANGFFLLMT